MVVVVRYLKNIGLEQAITLVFNLLSPMINCLFFLSDSMKPENEAAPAPLKRRTREEEPIYERIPAGDQSVQQKGQ